MVVDLSSFVTKDNADEGVIFPVKIDGRKYPIAIRIYGDDSDAVKEYNETLLRKIGFNGLDKIDNETAEEILNSKDDGVYVRIGGVYAYDWKKKECTNDEIVIKDRKILNDKASYVYMLEKIPELKAFILNKSNERANFLDGTNTN